MSSAAVLFKGTGGTTKSHTSTYQEARVTMPTANNDAQQGRNEEERRRQFVPRPMPLASEEQMHARHLRGGRSEKCILRDPVVLLVAAHNPGAGQEF
jgi:hypothetical protein